MSYVCTSCQKLVETPGDFCPFCGQQNIEAPPGLSNGQKMKIYSVSFFLAPLGLIWFFKFYKDEDPLKRKAGYYALAITLVVVFGSLITGKLILNKFEKIYAPTLELYGELGY